MSQSHTFQLQIYLKMIQTLKTANIGITIKILVAYGFLISIFRFDRNPKMVTDMAKITTAIKC